MNEIIYLNGFLMPIEQANISVLDYGFLYGYGLFETMRAYSGHIFLLDRHLERLNNAVKILGISIEEQDIKTAIRDTLKANNLDNSRIRLTVTPGKGTMVPNPDTCSEPTILILATHFQPYSEQIYNRGYTAIISNIRRNSQSFLCNIKSVSYLESIMAKQEAKKAGADEAIFLNDHGLLAEASMSNIFLVTNNALRTPAINSGILPGITRKFILELAGQSGVTVIEEDIELKDLFAAQEAFLANSLIEIMPLVSLEHTTIGTGTPGHITRKLMQSYKEKTRQSQWF